MERGSSPGGDRTGQRPRGPVLRTSTGCYDGRIRAAVIDLSQRVLKRDLVTRSEPLRYTGELVGVAYLYGQGRRLDEYRVGDPDTQHGEDDDVGDDLDEGFEDVEDIFVTDAYDGLEMPLQTPLPAAPVGVPSLAAAGPQGPATARVPSSADAGPQSPADAGPQNPAAGPQSPAAAAAPGSAAAAAAAAVAGAPGPAAAAAPGPAAAAAAAAAPSGPGSATAAAAAPRPAAAAAPGPAAAAARGPAAAAAATAAAPGPAAAAAAAAAASWPAAARAHNLSRHGNQPPPAPPAVDAASWSPADAQPDLEGRSSPGPGAVVAAAQSPAIPLTPDWAAEGLPEVRLLRVASTFLFHSGSFFLLNYEIRYLG
ncbi:skin secretory protein xP2-like isoform X1 [Amphibalanus amphitrite]|uniref:skin secretory protein xP2-like isoform X1 n=1 Tax=Amphibalanus amphitrite TaxID=1232801 RepID=UPI001C90F391|nr:skin secretory protein xP2-like isoform X1 [Amphibalanus amphitrite]XP_043208726.1 skin secretory protein xP2-like isoform X1 [Amphibalanus amphitrite]